MGAGHLPHEQDDGHHHQPRRDHGRATTDRVREGLTHHPSTGGDKNQEEGPEQFGEQAPPLLPRILEVRDRLDNLHLEPSLEASLERHGLFLSHHHSHPPARSSTTLLAISRRSCHETLAPNSARRQANPRDSTVWEIWSRPLACSPPSQALVWLRRSRVGRTLMTQIGAPANPPPDRRRHFVPRHEGHRPNCQASSNRRSKRPT